MSTQDKSQALIDSLPLLENNEQFIFACNESVPCLNRCCTDITLPLTPYDVMRICSHLGVGSEQFLKKHTQMRAMPDSGFPLPLLKMQDGPKEICPFATSAGCSIYQDRPGACRTFPLGRGTKIDDNGNIVERFFRVQEDFCHGFNNGQTWTAQTWIENQGLIPFNESNDQYMRLITLVKKANKPITSKLASMIILCLFQLDRFRDFLGEMHIFSKLEIDTDYCEQIMSNDDVCLNFAYDWIEMVIFGSCPRLKRKD